MSGAGSSRYAPWVIDPGYIARSVREGFAAADAGVKIQVQRYYGELYDAARLRQWFRDKVDGLINLKAGLREDGAPARWAGKAADDRRFRRFVCRCRECEHVRNYHPDNTRARARVISRCTRCVGRHEEGGGRKWEESWQAGCRRDQYALRERRSVRRFETDAVRVRFADREDSE